MFIRAPRGHCIWRRQPAGAATLVAIVVIAAITLAVALRASFWSVSGLVAAFGASQAAVATAGLDGCVDEALLRILRQSDYGGGAFGIGSAGCVVSVQGSGVTRTIAATSTVSTFIRAATVDVSLVGGAVTVTRFEETE